MDSLAKTSAEPWALQSRFPKPDPLQRLQDFEVLVREWWNEHAVVRFISPGYRALWHQRPDEDLGQWQWFGAWFEENPRGAPRDPAMYIRFDWARRADALDRFLQLGTLDPRQGLRELAMLNLSQALVDGRKAVDEALASATPTTTLAERDNVLKSLADPARTPAPNAKKYDPSKLTPEERDLWLDFQERSEIKR